MNKAFLYAGAIFIGSFVHSAYANFDSAGATVPISLSEAVNRAVSVDLRHKLQQNNLQSSVANLAAVRATNDLKTSINLKAGKNTSQRDKIATDNSFIVTQNLYNGGLYNANINMSKARIGVVKQAIKVSQAEIVSEVISEYINLLQLQDKKKLLSKNFTALKDLHAEYKRRVDIGVGKVAILSRLQQKVATAEIAIDSLNSDLANTQDRLRYLLQVDDNFVLQLQPINAVDPSVINMIRNNIQANDIDSLQHPKMQKIRQQINVAGYDYEAKKTANSPVVDLQGEATLKNQNEDSTHKSELGVFMNFSWNLSGGEFTHRLKEKQIALQNARVEYKFARNTILKNLRADLRNLDNVATTYTKIQKIHSQIITVERDSYVRFTTLTKSGQEYLARADVVNEFYTSELNLLGGYYKKIGMQYSLLDSAGYTLRYFAK